MARLELDNVSLAFRLPASAAPGGRHHALSHIRLSLRDGDRVGLVGHNGAGKTTLLRVMAGIYPPDSGTLVREGRAAALLSLGMGINMDLTGRANIPLIAIHLAISPRRIAPHVESIVDWTELGAFIDQPLRVYSAGMLIRLIFAVYTAVPPEILLLDEWLGVGDERFREKAQGRISAFVEQTPIMVLATHSPEIRDHWCNRVITLSEGRVISDQTSASALNTRAKT